MPRDQQHPMRLLTTVVVTVADWSARVECGFHALHLGWEASGRSPEGTGTSPSVRRFRSGILPDALASSERGLWL